jgi:hypothetical protein
VGVQLVCDHCKRSVLSVVPIILAQNPTAIGGGYCFRCIAERLESEKNAIEKEKLE